MKLLVLTQGDGKPVILDPKDFLYAMDIQEIDKEQLPESQKANAKTVLAIKSRLVNFAIAQTVIEIADQMKDL